MKITVDLTEEEVAGLICTNCETCLLGGFIKSGIAKRCLEIRRSSREKFLKSYTEAKTAISDEEANKKEYNYLFSYHHSQGLGSGVITFAKEVTTYKDLKEISKYFEEKGAIKNVGILSFQLLNISEVKENAASNGKDETRC